MKVFQRPSNINDKVAVHIIIFSFQWLCEKVGVLRKRQDKNDLESFPVYMLRNKVVADIFLLRNAGGCRVVGHVNRPYIILLNHSASHIYIWKDKTLDVSEVNRLFRAIRHGSVLGF